MVRLVITSLMSTKYSTDIGYAGRFDFFERQQTPQNICFLTNLKCSTAYLATTSG